MIHVLGAGNIGSLFALALSRKFPVEFLLKPSSLKQYIDVSRSTVRIRTPSLGGAEWEKHIPGADATRLSTPISQLVVAVKTHDIKKALLGVKHAITPQTEVMIIHNGMGVREQVADIWPQAEERPVLGYAITDAGMKRHAPQWTFDYTGRGTCTFTTSQNENHTQLGAMLLDSRELVVSKYMPPGLFETIQKKKLVVNSVINPLTAILQCPNGALISLENQTSHRLMMRIVNESSKVLGLDRSEMWDMTLDVIKKTASNLSSMLCDAEQGRQTEIEFINGYIVREAERQEIYAPLNAMLRDLVKMRRLQSRHEELSVLPLDLDYSAQSKL